MILTLATAIVLTSATMGIGAPVVSFSPTDESKVPHYFGPYSNWANSPQVLPDALVTFTGDGTGAEGTATVDPNTGGITAVTITSPGSGYTTPPTVEFSSAVAVPTTTATATATISPGVITSIAVAETGFGYTEPSVAITGGGVPSVVATAQALGGVDDVTLVSGSTGYNTPSVEFGLPDIPLAPAGAGVRATGSVTMDASGVITSVTVQNPGFGYYSAPTVSILDAGAPFGSPAVVTSTINVTQIDVTVGGAGYDSVPDVTITDATGTGTGATATATVAVLGAVTDVIVDTPGAGYLTPGLKKFMDTLPGLTPAGANNLGQYIPVAVPDTTTYPGTDYYEIAVVQYREQMHSQLPATLLRGYVQLSTSVVPGAHVQLTNANLAGGTTDIAGYFGVDDPHYLGPTIVARKDRPVRILFRNLLPNGKEGNLFLPVDTSIMGSGMGPDAIQLDEDGVPMDMAVDDGTVLDGVRNPAADQLDANGEKPAGVYTDNRATLHLHGGITPWISDGTPHQWITPAPWTGPNAPSYPKGVSVRNVPDMPDPGEGAMTFFYTNQQSARLMFYHDHAWGITRLNVYAGNAAPYIIGDATEDKLIADGLIPGAADTIPLVIQDKTFVPANIHDHRPHLGHDPLGRRRQPVAAARLHAGAEPERSQRHEPVRTLDVRPLVLAPRVQHQVRSDRQPLLRPRPDRSARRTRLRAAADPRHREQLRGYGSVHGHPGGERHGLSEDPGPAEDLPLPHPERGQRPLLEPVLVRGRSAHGHAERSRV